MVRARNRALQDGDERLVERAEVLEDIRVAEEQIARGEGIEHEEAKRQILARIRR